MLIRLLIIAITTTCSMSAADDTNTKDGVAAIELQVATFSVDITPKLHAPVGLGFIPSLKSVEHPLLARGVLLMGADVQCVLCTLDIMEIHNESYDFLRQAIAKAARIEESNVSLQCLHQHTAPALSTAALRLERGNDDLRRIATAEYLTLIAERMSAAIKQALHRRRKATHVGIGRAVVEKVASNRRIEMPNGSIQGRSSSTKGSPHLRELPEGLIDPWVRTISFDDGDRAIAHLHYYASHPQSFYGDGRVSYDVPGMIRENLTKTTGAFQLYVTGCGGDIAYGKYNDGSKEVRNRIVARLQAGIESSIAGIARQPVALMRWSVERLRFPLRMNESYLEQHNRKILKDANAGESVRRKAAIALAWIERVKSGRPVELSCLAINDVRVLHLPGEPFVQFQLAAQKMRADRFVCVAGYGDCGMGYIGGDRIYTDNGGYEQSYAFSGPCEELLLDAIEHLLND